MILGKHDNAGTAAVKVEPSQMDATQKMISKTPQAFPLPHLFLASANIAQARNGYLLSFIFAIRVVCTNALIMCGGYCESATTFRIQTLVVVARSFAAH